MRRNILVLLGLAALFVQSASGANWKVIPSPNGPLEVNQLHGVSALSENDVWAVGVSYNAERTLASTLIEHWNGAQWSVVPSPKSERHDQRARGSRSCGAERRLGSRFFRENTAFDPNHALEWSYL